jgi:hypothetical protein
MYVVVEVRFQTHISKIQVVYLVISLRFRLYNSLEKISQHPLHGWLVRYLVGLDSENLSSSQQSVTLLSNLTDETDFTTFVSNTATTILDHHNWQAKDPQ